MISEGPNWIEALPGPLQEALDRTLAPEERLLICVRGQPRHALAATERRLIHLEEPDPTKAVGAAQATSWPLGAVRDLRLEEAPQGARLCWQGQPEGAVGSPEANQPVRFEVPTYDREKFRRVFDRLQRLLPAEAPATRMGERPMAQPSTRSCPKCATAIPPEGAWCPACGLQVEEICWQCGTLQAAEWAFCPRCGLSAGEPGAIPCPSCREPVARGFAFCPRCGAAARPVCSECGRPLRREWAFCPDCGTAAGAAAEAELDEEDELTADRRSAPAQARGSRSAVGGQRSAVASPEAEAFNREGVRLYEADQLDAAIAAFRQAVALDPNNAGYHTRLATALDERELDAEALAEYQRAIDLDPRQSLALLNLGYLYSESERYEEARQLWEQVIRIDPSSQDADEARQNLQNLDEL
jgi:RNA polymerase subunit RPABC4/transcription elongation factor Spt4